MSGSRRSADQLVTEALTHIDVLNSHLVQGDLTTGIVLDAVCMRLSAALEVLNQGEPALGERLFPGQWRDMWATRNRIAHGYAFIDSSIVADTIRNDLPEFERVLREEQDRFQG